MLCAVVVAVAAAVVGYVDLVSAPDAAEVAAPVARGVDERDVAPGLVADPQPGAATAVDHVRETARRQCPHPRREAGHDGRVVEVVGLA